MNRIGQELPEVKPQADFVPPDAAGASARLDDPCMSESGLRVAGHVHDTATLQREVVRHASDVPHAHDDGDTRASRPCKTSRRRSLDLTILLAMTVVMGLLALMFITFP
jgi:hypothetical protein